MKRYVMLCYVMVVHHSTATWCGEAGLLSRPPVYRLPAPAGASPSLSPIFLRCVCLYLRCGARARTAAGRARSPIARSNVHPNGEPRRACPRVRTCLGGAARENVVGAGEGPERTVCLSVWANFTCSSFGSLEALRPMVSTRHRESLPVAPGGAGGHRCHAKEDASRLEKTAGSHSYQPRPKNAP